MRRPAATDQVEALVNYLGASPSIPMLEEVLKYYKREEKRILSEDLLEWMQENDQVNFETDDFKVSINTYVSAKVLNPDDAFNWLSNHQYGDLIKDTLEFPKGEFNVDAQAALEALGLSYTKKSGIHPMSLKKIMKDRLKDGEDMPCEDDGININYYDECVIKEK